MVGADKDTNLIRGSVTWIALSCLDCGMEHIFFSAAVLLYLSVFSAMLSSHVQVSVSHLHADLCLLHFLSGSAHFSVFSALTTTAELPCVFLQLFLSCRHRRTDVNNLTAGSCPADPYGFTGMDQDY